MPFDTIYLVYAALFVGAIFLAEGVFYLIVDSKEHSKANRRMNMLASGKDASEVFEALRRKPLRRIPYLGPLGIPLVHLESTLAKSGLSVSLGRFLLFMAAVTVVSVVVLILMLQRSALPNVLATNAACIVLALLIGVGMPLLVVAQMKSSRLKKFGEQLPDTLDVMVRSLHAGHPIASALKLVTEEMPDPVGTEFGIAVDEMTYGLELRHSLENMAERIGQSDFKYVVVAINIQHETGGNLAETLENLSTVLRGRRMLKLKIKALSGEAKASAYIIGSLPFVMGILIYLVNADYIMDLFIDPRGHLLIGLGLTSFAIGATVMYRMVKFEV